ncbi:MAG: ribosome maturation factor RimM [Campylobacterota bacterium]
MKNSNNIYVAKLGKTVGLKGHLRLFIDSDFPGQFKQGAVFKTNKNIQLTVKEYNNKSNVILFEEFRDIDEAKILTNQHLYTTIEETRKNCKLEKNEFFWFDLVDCEVIEDDNILGLVQEIHRFPSSDYLEVKTSVSLVKQGFSKTFLIPHLFDTYIKEVNIKEKRIYVQDAMDILQNS